MRDCLEERCLWHARKCIGPRPAGRGAGYADPAGEVVIVDLIVDVIDCPKLDYVND